MAEHIYMFSGESVRAKFMAKNYIIDQVIDWYGTEVEIETQNEEESLITVYVNKEAFFCWAMQYGLHIEVLEPMDVRQRIIDSIKYMGEKYKGDKGGNNFNSHKSG